jgi:hypothetical protein
MFDHQTPLPTPMLQDKKCNISIVLGTTWTQEMTWVIGNNLDFEGAKVPLPERFPFLE